MKELIKIYICDDDVDFTKEIAQIIRALLNDKRECEILTFPSGNALLMQCNKERADVVFLDIEMPDLNGFETAKKLRDIKRETLIVFITCHEDRVYQSWEYQPFWFVRKRFISDLEIVMTRLLEKIDAEYEKNNGYFLLNTEKCAVELDINKVVTIESCRHDIIIKDKNGEKQQYRCKISDAAEQTHDLYVVRVQNGVLVNCRFISKITSREVIMTTGETIGLSRNRMDSVREAFHEFLRSR